MTVEFDAFVENVRRRCARPGAARMCYGYAYLISGDPDHLAGYQRCARRMLDRFGDDPTAVHDAVRNGLLIPGSGFELERLPLASLRENVAQGDSLGQIEAWTHLGQALVSYRAGEFQDAIDASDAGIVACQTTFQYLRDICRAIHLSIKSLALTGQGNLEESQQRLDEAVALVKLGATYDDEGYLLGESVSGRDYLIADLLIHEAREKIAKARKPE